MDPFMPAAGVERDRAIEQLRRYCELLLQWNRKVSNLISKNDESRIVARHIVESVAAAEWIRGFGATRYLDFGSGGGLPAIPLALLGVGAAWTLVESRRTKTLFLRRAVQELGLAHVTVEQTRLEDLVASGDHAGAFDGFTSRATLTLGPTLELAAALVSPGGSAYLWKGTRREEEMSAAGPWRSQWDVAGEKMIGDGPTSVVRFVKRSID